MRLAVASGKGGTGKTTVAVGLGLALAGRVEGLQLVDCDVEEPNAGLLLKPVMDGSWPVCLKIPEVDTEKCTGCGRCHDVCRYNAIAMVGNKALVFENLCHACGGCSLVCPEDAIKESDKVIGSVEEGHSQNIRFLRGILNVGEPMATPVVRAVKAKAAPDRPTILDAPPGTACPVVATVKDCDFCILVTEPTPFGLYDLDLMVKVVRELGIPSGIVINKDAEWSSEITGYANRVGLPILMRIPFSRAIAVLYSKGQPLNHLEGSWNDRFYDLYRTVGEML